MIDHALDNHGHTEHATSYFPASMGIPGGNTMISNGTPMGVSPYNSYNQYGTSPGMFGSGGMLGARGPSPYGAAPGGMMGSSNQPPVNSWLMRSVTGPSFSPPAPAEAAAAWSNHASVAAQKAQHVYLDIERIKADAIQKINDLNATADNTIGSMKELRDTYIRDLQQESQNITSGYMAAKAAVSKMFKEAAQYTRSAADLARGTNDALRNKEFASELSSKVSKSSFAQVHPTSSLPEKIQNPKELELVMKMIRAHMKQMGKGGSVSSEKIKSSEVAPVAAETKTASAAASEAKINKDISSRSSKSAARIASAPADAKEQEFLMKIAGATLMHDTATVMNTQLKAANDLVNKFTLKEIQAEQKILQAISAAQKSVLKGASVASRASVIAGKALAEIQALKQQTEHAQNAAGQALAAQMAQAMGFPIAAKAVPSPFAPPSRFPFVGPTATPRGQVYSASVDMNLLVVVQPMGRTSFSSFL